MAFSLSNAQVGIDSTTELIHQQEREHEQRRRLEPDVDIHITPEALQNRDRLPLGEVPCLKVQHIDIEPSSATSTERLQWLAEVLAGPTHDDAPVGKCLGSQGIAMVVKRAQAALSAQGFVTSRVYAKQQDLSGGTLTLSVVPGRVRAIRFAEQVQPASSPRMALWNTAATRAGDILNLRDIEQTLENLKRVPTAQADIRIEPADAPDQSDLVISHSQKFPIRLGISADDSGTKATGKYQGSATFSLDNLLTLSELFYVTINNDLGGGDPGARGTRGHVVHYSMPVGYWSVGATGSANRYYQSVAGINQTYIYRGNSETAELSLLRMVQRDATRKTEVRLKAFQRRSNNYIDDTEIMVQRRIVGGWEVGVSHKSAIGDAKVEGSFSYKRGTGDFDTLAAPEELIGDGTSRFGLLLLDATLSLPFKTGGQAMRYSGTLRIQNNTTPLTPQDRFAIGSRYSVRGFDGDSILSAERGWLVRNELSAALGGSGQQAYLGLDYGEVAGPSSELLAGKALAGAVLGLRGAWGALQYDLFAGTPLHMPKGFKTASAVSGFNLNWMW